jgi:rubredoxin-NAD+ reductase
MSKEIHSKAALGVWNVRKSQNRASFFDSIKPQRKTNTSKKEKEIDSMKYVCDVCGWEYDEELGYPEGGIAPGTKWEDVPADFQCPLCYVGKDEFSEE